MMLSWSSHYPFWPCHVISATHHDFSWGSWLECPCSWLAYSSSWIVEACHRVSLSHLLTFWSSRDVVVVVVAPTVEGLFHVHWLTFEVSGNFILWRWNLVEPASLCGCLSMLLVCFNWFRVRVWIGLKVQLVWRNWHELCLSFVSFFIHGLKSTPTYYKLQLGLNIKLWCEH